MFSRSLSQKIAVRPRDMLIFTVHLRWTSFNTKNDAFRGSKRVCLEIGYPICRLIIMFSINMSRRQPPNLTQIRLLVMSHDTSMVNRYSHKLPNVRFQCFKALNCMVYTLFGLKSVESPLPQCGAPASGSKLPQLDGESMSILHEIQ